MKLSTREIQTIINALYVAAETFDSDASAMNGTGNLRLQGQFECQAIEARQLRDRLEQVVEVDLLVA